MEPKTGKRIVSKGAYVKAHGQRATVGVFAVGLAGLAALCGVVTLGSLIACPAEWLGWWGKNSRIEEMLNMGVMLLFGAGVFVFGRLANNTMKVAADIDCGIPLTRANTANLPAPDSLVRASSEPLQAQEAVLLRAATEWQETPPDQLVRASLGQKEW